MSIIFEPCFSGINPVECEAEGLAGQLVLGGYDENSTVVPSVEFFPPFHTCHIPDLPQPRVDHSASLLSGGRIIVCGGLTSDSVPVKPQYNTLELRSQHRIANDVPATLYSRVPMNVEIVVLNCQKCKQCLKGHKCLVLLFEGVL